MIRENCLNCSLLDKEHSCCSIDEDKQSIKEFELEATWCTKHRLVNE